MNTMEYAKVFQAELDKMAEHELLTNWMDANAGQVKYTGGNEVKIPIMSVDGLADYGREGNTGYVTGGIQLKYQTKMLTQDRGRQFIIDANDVDESNFVATVGNIMGEFQRTQVIPEIDAYRISKLASETNEDNIKEGYEPKKDTILEEIKEGIKTIRKHGYQGPLVMHMTYDALTELEIATAGKLRDTTFSVGGIDTRVPEIDGVPIIPTPDNRMVTAIEILDGKTEGQTAGGFKPGDTAKEINFLISARTTPIAVTKQDHMRIFDPNTYQAANAYSMDYRRYHDLWVKENQDKTIFVNTK